MVARKIKEWNDHNNCGAVVGATYPEELKVIRSILGDEIPLLIPGIGKQGGDVKKTVKHGFFIILLLTLVVAFEEISWGQRIFGIATPDCIKQINVQNEITLHNLLPFQRYRHWLLILFGCIGFVLIYLKTYTYKIDDQLLFFSPPKSC